MRRFLPSFANIITVTLLCVSTLFLLDALKPKEPAFTASSATNPQPTENQLAEVVNEEVPTNVSEATSRPLFSPSRRVPEIVALPEALEPTPVAPPPPPVEVPVVEPPAITMIGILEDNGQLKALIRGEDNAEQWVEMEAKIEGWQVVHITSVSITLQLNGESVDIYTVD